MRPTRAWGVFTLAVSMLGCTTELPKGAYRCDEQHACTVGWFCAADGYCHDLDAGAPIGCAKRDGGDCAAGWKCGFEGICHPQVDAGAIPCRYGIAEGDSDCTNGWRCGFAGACVDSSGEKLADIPSGGVGTPVASVPLLPRGVGKGHFNLPQSRVESVLMQAEDGGDFYFVRRNSRNDVPDITTVKLPARGVGDSFAVGMNGFWFLRDGGLYWMDGIDGGIAEVRDAKQQPLGSDKAWPQRVTQLRMVPLIFDEGMPAKPERAMAFLPDASGAWQLVSGDDGGALKFDAENETMIDFVGVPVRPPNFPGFQPDFCMASLYRVPGRPCPCLNLGSDAGGQPCTAELCHGPQLPDGGVEGTSGVGEVRMGANNLLSYVEWDLRQESNAYRIETTLKLKDLTALLSAGCWLPGLGGDPFTVSCRRPCDDFESLVDFVPMRSGLVLGFDVACERPGGQRVWRRLVPSASGSNDNTCARVDLEGTTVSFGAALTPAIMGDQRASVTPLHRPQTPVVSAGGFARFVTPPGALGSNVVSGPDFVNSAPWVLDQPPNLVVVVPPLGTIALSSSVLGQRGPSGHFFASAVDPNSSLSAVAKVEGFPLKAVTNARSLMDVSFAQGIPEIRIVGKLNISASSFGEPVHASKVSRSQGDLIMVSTRDQLLVGPSLEDGGFTELSPVLVPSPGNDIIALAPSAPDPGLIAQAWVATSTNVFRVSQNAQGRWQSQETRIEFPDFVRHAWVNPEDGRGRIGTSSGTIYSLPSGLKLAEPPAALKGTAQSYLQVCKQVFMIDEENLYALSVDAASGIGRWSAPLLSPGGVLKNGRLFAGNKELWVFGRWGDYWQVPLTSCP